MASGLKRLRPTYANITSTLALIVATSGGAYAVAKLPPNSVGTLQLKDGAVTSPKVLDGSLTAADFKRGELPPAGLGGLEVVYAASGSGPAGTKSSEAQCPTGKKVTGGGHIIAGGGNTSRVTVSAPGQAPDPTSWYVEATETTPTTASWTLYAYAVCVTAA